MQWNHFSLCVCVSADKAQTRSLSVRIGNAAKLSPTLGNSNSNCASACVNNVAPLVRLYYETVFDKTVGACLRQGSHPSRRLPCITPLVTAVVLLIFCFISSVPDGFGQQSQHRVLRFEKRQFILSPNFCVKYHDLCVMWSCFIILALFTSGYISTSGKRLARG